MHHYTDNSLPSDSSSTDSSLSPGSSSSSIAPSSIGNISAKTSSTESTSGLHIVLQRQLLSDLENSGGIKTASLQSVCNSKPDIYGHTGTPLRRQVQNKVARWKKLSTKSYQDLLDGASISIKTPVKKSPALQKDRKLPSTRSPTRSPLPSTTPKRRFQNFSSPTMSAEPKLNSYVAGILREGKYGKCSCESCSIIFPFSCSNADVISQIKSKSTWTSQNATGR